MPDHLHGPIYLSSCVRWKRRFIAPKVQSNSGECWEKPAEDTALVVYLATIIVSAQDILLHISQCKHIKVIVTVCCSFPLIPHLALNVCHGQTHLTELYLRSRLLNCVFLFFTAVIASSACNSGPLYTAQLCLATISGSTPVAGSPRSRIWLSVTLASALHKISASKSGSPAGRARIGEDLHSRFSRIEKKRWTKRKESLKARDALRCTLCDRQPNHTTNFTCQGRFSSRLTGAIFTLKE